MPFHHVSPDSALLWMCSCPCFVANVKRTWRKSWFTKCDMRGWEQRRASLAIHSIVSGTPIFKQPAVTVGRFEGRRIEMAGKGMNKAENSSASWYTFHASGWDTWLPDSRSACWLVCVFRTHSQFSNGYFTILFCLPLWGNSWKQRWSIQPQLRHFKIGIAHYCSMCWPSFRAELTNAKKKYRRKTWYVVMALWCAEKAILQDLLAK